MEQFLQFRFTKKFDREIIRLAIEADKRIIVPSDEELNSFFEIFESEIALSKEIAELNIEVNYKEEVFNISNDLKSLKDALTTSVLELKEEIRSLNISSNLIEEWNKQLDEILNNLKSFKAITAQQRLQNLEERIKEQPINDDKRLLARLYNLQAECLHQVGGKGIDPKQAILLIKTYSLQKHNTDYKTNAALSYFVINEIEKSELLTDELLRDNEFNAAAWALKCIYAGGNFREVLPAVPVSIRQNNTFKLHLNTWLFHGKLITTFNEIFTLKLDYSIDFSKEPIFSYKNFHYQHQIAYFLLNSFYNDYSKITSSLTYPEAKHDARFKYAFHILKQSSDALAGSEIEVAYAYFLFLYHCCSFILNEQREEVVQMEKMYNKMLEKPLDATLRLVQAYQSINSQELILKAIYLINELAEIPDFLLLLQAGNYYTVGDKDKKTDVFIQFLRRACKVDRFFLLNFISFIRYHGVEKTDELKDAVKNLFLLPFEGQDYYIPLEIFCFLQLNLGDFDNEKLLELLEQAEEMMDIADTDLSIHIAFAYAVTDQIDRAKSFLERNLDLTKPSEWVKLYCKVLYKSRGNKVELLEILKRWRINFDSDFELLQIEFDLRYLENNWTQAIEIGKRAISVFPESEYFLNGLFSALNNALQIEDIKAFSHLVINKQFKEQHYAINISQALLRAALYFESLDLLYNHASRKENKQCRQTYIAVSISYPDHLLIQYEEVVLDSYIKYQTKESSTTIHLTEENKAIYPNSLFIGRKLGETFTVRTSLTNLFETITIVRITDKYLALLDEILEDAKNPISGLQIQSFKFKDDTVDGMVETLIENFGVKGTLEQERIQNEYEKYYSGKISFAEITNSVFRREFVDAYFLLTHQEGKRFKAISPAISPNHYPSETAYVLDFTSVCLFYQLSSECFLLFETKFVISPLIRQKIIQNLEETKFNPAPEALL